MCLTKVSKFVHHILTLNINLTRRLRFVNLFNVKLCRDIKFIKNAIIVKNYQLSFDVSICFIGDSDICRCCNSISALFNGPYSFNILD